MTRESVDALFFSYFEDIDRWRNDHLGGGPAVSTTGVRPERAGDETDHSEFSRLVSQSVGIDGGLYDLPRFLSWTAHGTTAEYRRYNPFSITHLSGSYVRSFTAPHGFDVRHVNHTSRVELPELAETFDPRWILISTTFLSETTRIFDVCRRVRQLWPDAGVVVGGLVLIELEKSMPTKGFERLLHACGADAYVLTPQGESVLLEILAHEPGELEGLSLAHTRVRSAGGYPPALSCAEASIPLEDAWVRWSRLDPASLYHAVHTRTARSCSFRCTFCTFPQLQGPLEQMSPDALDRELTELEALGSVRSLVFTDDTFNVPPGRFKDLCRVLARHETDWYSFFRPQFCDAETALLMKEARCRAVFLGVESADDQMLVRMGKPASIAKVRRGIEHLQDQDIPLHANFIVGFPGDVPENAQKIVDFLDQTGIDFFYASAWFNSPTAPISKQAEEYGIEGLYYRWKHDTMTSAEAIELEKSIQKAPRHALFASEYTQFTFWGEVMLFVNGFDLSEVRQAFATFNEFTGRDTPAASLRADPRVAALKGLLLRAPFPAPAEPIGRRCASPVAAAAPAPPGGPA